MNRGGLKSASGSVGNLQSLTQGGGGGNKLAQKSLNNNNNNNVTLTQTPIQGDYLHPFAFPIVNNENNNNSNNFNNQFNMQQQQQQQQPQPYQFVQMQGAQHPFHTPQGIYHTTQTGGLQTQGQGMHSSVSMPAFRMQQPHTQPQQPQQAIPLYAPVQQQPQQQQQPMQTFHAGHSHSASMGANSNTGNDLKVRFQEMPFGN